MGALAFVALQVGRLSSGIWLVLFAAAGMLVYNPFLLRYDLGFQLSFLATLVLVVGLARFRAREVLVQAWWWPVMEIGLATLGIELVVGPLLLSTFGYISLVSIPANILILPVVPLAMLIGFLVVLVGLFVPPMLNIFAWLAYFLTGYMLWVVEFCAHFSWATLQWRITSWQIVLWYTGLIGVFLWKQRHVWRNTGDGGRSEDSVSS
jgi:competence protein ComEC